MKRNQRVPIRERDQPLGPETNVLEITKWFRSKTDRENMSVMEPH